MRAWWLGGLVLAGCGFSLEGGSVPDDGRPPDMPPPDDPPPDMTTQRVTTDLIGLWRFDENGGTTVTDTAGATPTNLVIIDPPSFSWDVEQLLVNAPGDVNTTAGAYFLIQPAKQADQVTIEAWVTPANTTQVGSPPTTHPARVVSLTVRNAGQHLIGLGQDAGTWVAQVRTDNAGVDGHGGPWLRHTEPVALAPTHLVITSTPTTRTFYVNGEDVSDTRGGLLDNWKDTFVLQMAGDPLKRNTWLGTLHLVAMYDRALSKQDVATNFAAGP